MTLQGIRNTNGSAPWLVETLELSKRYGPRMVVNAITTKINEGDIVAVIGPNGAGKTTFIEIIMGIKKPDAGIVKFNESYAKVTLGAQLQETPVFPGLSVIENILLFAGLFRVTIHPASIKKMLDEASLTEVSNTQAVKLSLGQQRRLAIMLALIHNPQLIFLDEPTSGLDPQAQRDVRSLLSKLAAIHKTIVFTSHDMVEVESVATTVMFILGGRLIATGSPKNLCTNYDVRDMTELYLKLVES
jgi:ABC-2 type transport system ATP-binding protein